MAGTGIRIRPIIYASRVEGRPARQDSKKRGKRRPSGLAKFSAAIDRTISRREGARMLASPANRRKLYGLVLMAILVFVIFSFTGAPKMSAIARKPRIGLFMARAGDYLTRMAFHAQLLECYAKKHGYIMIPNVVHPNCDGPDWKDYSICWSRMCSMKNYFKTLSLDWIVVIDADSGLINHTQTIEAILPPTGVDMVFTVRWKSGEFCSCGYMLRNTPNAFKLLDIWLSYREFNKNCVENPPLHLALLELAKPKSPHLPRCKSIFNGGHWDGGFEGFLKGFDGFVNCAKTSLGPGIDFGAARVQVIGQAWYNTIAEDIGFKVTGNELFVHGVKHADWLYSLKGDADDVKKLKNQCMSHPDAWKPPIRPDNFVSKDVMRRLVVRSDFQKTLDFPDRPIRPNPQVFDCWPNCEEETFYFRRDPNEEFECIDAHEKRIGKKITMKTPELLAWVDKCHEGDEKNKVRYAGQ